MRPLPLFKLANIILFPLLASCFILSGCADEPAAPESIKIGLITYKSEALARQMGIPTTNAAQMAVDETNAAGGIRIGGRKVPVELIIRSINSSPQEAVAATRKLTNRDNVVAIVGPQNSSEAIPAGAFAEKAHVPMISPMSTNRRTTENRKYVFRMSFIDDFQGAVMASFARTDLQAKTAAILHDTADPYSRGVAKVFMKTFRDMGGEVTLDEHFLSGETDFMPQLQRIRKMKADVLLLPNFANTAKIQVIQARRLGIDAHLLGCDGWDETILAGLPEFVGAFMSTHWTHDLDSTVSQSFTRKYSEQFEEEPVVAAALTYDAIKLLIQAIEKAQHTESERLHTAISTLGQVDGVTGQVDFSKGNNPEKAVVILQFVGQHGKFYKQVTPKP